MKRMVFGVALCALVLDGVAGAQPAAPPSSTAPPGVPSNSYPGSSAPSSSDAPKSSPKADALAAANRAQIKKCIDEHKASHSTLSDEELKSWCKVHANSKPRDP